MAPSSLHPAAIPTCRFLLVKYDPRQEAVGQVFEQEASMPLKEAHKRSKAEKGKLEHTRISLQILGEPG